MAGPWPWDRAAQPAFGKSKRRDGRFGKAGPACDHEADACTCPAGRQMRPRQKACRTPRPLVDKDGMVRYRTGRPDCDRCAPGHRCCPKAPARRILRSIHEGARDMARDIIATDACVDSSRAQKKVGMLVAHPKRILKLDRLRLCGPNGARDEFHLAATVQNPGKPAKLIPMPVPKTAQEPLRLPQR